MGACRTTVKTTVIVVWLLMTLLTEAIKVGTNFLCSNAAI